MTVRLRGSAALFIRVCATVSLAACGRSAVTRTPAVSFTYASEAVWPRPGPGRSGHCPADTFEFADVCSVCSEQHERACETACSDGNADACSAVGGFREAIFYYRLPGDYRGAAKYYERGCRLGSGDACESLARLLMRGEGRPKDEHAALLLLDRMCAAGRKRACTAAGVATIAGRGCAPDSKRGLWLIQVGCAKGDVEGCLLAKDEHVLQDVDAAVAAAREKIVACLKGELNSCQFGMTPLTDLRTLRPKPDQ